MVNTMCDIMVGVFEDLEITYNLYVDQKIKYA